MFEFLSHRAPDLVGPAPRSAPAAIRFGVLILIVVSAVVWVSSRDWNGTSEAPVSAQRIGELVARAGLQPIGYFHEPITGLQGVEISRLGCPKPVALLPVHSMNAEIAPGALRYSDGGYSVAYAFDGGIYSASGISYKIGVIALLRRLTSIVARSDTKHLAYYFKIWTPRGCAELTSAEVERLRDAD
jgi:hypothetical protein